MTDHCESCHFGMPIFSAAELNEKLKSLPDWHFIAEKNLIEKTLSFKNYYHVMAFVNAIAFMAHQEKHHPDLIVSYNKVIVQYTTHEAGGVTKNDLICAQRVECILNQV